jgi:hypothetical protein
MSAPIKRIDPHEAQNYIPLKEDFASNPPKYFTLTPSQDPQYPGSDGWEEVTYYTGRKLDLYSNREGDGDSWVYVLSNPSIPNQLKIGSTQKNPDVRAKQLSRGTGVPTGFVVEFAFKCFNAEAAEKEIHKVLGDCRVSKDREFFMVSIQEAEDIVRKVGKKYL